MAKRNGVTTNPRLNKQRPVAHCEWASNEAQRAWQRAVNQFGTNSPEAERACSMGIVRYGGVPVVSRPLPPSAKKADTPKVQKPQRAPFGLMGLAAYYLLASMQGQKAVRT